MFFHDCSVLLDYSQTDTQGCLCLDSHAAQKTLGKVLSFGSSRDVFLCLLSKVTNNCRKKDSKRSPAPPVNQLPSPPLPPEPDMLFSEEPDAAQISQRLAAAGGSAPQLPHSCRPRIGRGGRLIFDR